MAAAVRAAKAKRAGEEVDETTKALAAAFDARIGAMVRSRFGGHCERLVSRRAPTAVEISSSSSTLGLPTYECYGLTETTGLLTSDHGGAVRFGTVGPAIAGVELRIADDGEVLARGANVFPGYFKDPAATAECLKDGWLHTGDIGHLDGEFLVITNRKKNILITAGGKNITPSNLENEVKNDPLISYCHMHANRRPYPLALGVPRSRAPRGHREERRAARGDVGGRAARRPGHRRGGAGREDRSRERRLRALRADPGSSRSCRTSSRSKAAS